MCVIAAASLSVSKQLISFLLCFLSLTEFKSNLNAVICEESAECAAIISVIMTASDVSS